MISTENKAWYVEYGLEKEYEFVEQIAPLCELEAQIHPDKKDNPYCADLIVDDNIADLKYQETPFFKAEKQYGISPQYAVTLNKKDVDRYSELYPGIHIYFWVEREWQIEYDVEIKKMSGVWGASLKKIKALIAAGKAPLHTYYRRVDDTQGNGKDSYILDLADLKLVKRWL